MILRRKCVLNLVAILLLMPAMVLAQESEPGEIDRWDTWFIMGNKVVFGGQNDFKHSHEIQWRADENISQLNTIFYEAVLTYSPNEHWEIVPDFRYSKKPNRREIRPGFGIVRKDVFGNENKLWAFAQQVKYQADFKTNDFKTTQAVRYVPNVTKIINKKYAVGALAAVLYQWGPDFPSRVAFLRYGASLGIIFDEVHSLNFTPAFGAENLGGDLGWVHSFTPIFQLIIRVRKDYKYLPARYINF